MGRLYNIFLPARNRIMNGKHGSMPNDERQQDGTTRTTGGSLEGGIDAGTTDLGSDVYRGADEGRTGEHVHSDTGSLEGGIDAGTTDLGDDVYRGAVDDRPSTRGTLEGGIDAGTTDLGDDVYRGR